MASGRSHDHATRLLALPFGLLWTPFGLGAVAIATGAFLIGGLWLSPDLDTRSLATRRWGPLRLLWWPYRRLLKHRSIWSHCPAIGTAGRLFYLGSVMGLGSVLLMPFGIPGPEELLQAAQWLWSEQKPLLVAGLAGIELSSWLHLLQDGDPMPRLRWNPLLLSKPFSPRRQTNRSRTSKKGRGRPWWR
jgi:uncharacterized metal-binding protein